MGWSECAWRQGQAYPHLWGVQCPSKPASPWQLVGHSIPVQPISSSDLCNTTLFRTWLCQSALTLTDLQGDPHTLLQAGRLSERTGENLERRGESYKTIFHKYCVYKSSWGHMGLLVFATEKPVEYHQIMNLRLNAHSHTVRCHFIRYIYTQCSNWHSWKKEWYDFKLASLLFFTENTKQTTEIYLVSSDRPLPMYKFYIFISYT